MEIVGIIIFVTFITAVFAGMIALQIYLSKKRNAILGLILPVISFSFAFQMTSLTAIEPAEKYGIIDEPGYQFTILFVFLVWVIPAFVHTIIYIVNRLKIHRNRKDK